MSDLTRLTIPFGNILDDLDDLHRELDRAYCIGDVNLESNALALCELMRLFGRALAAMVEMPREQLPKVARG